MKISTFALHGAQVARLEAMTAYSIFDDNPENEDYPYVVMGDNLARDWSDKSNDGLEVYSTIHIWSRYPGRKEADEMASAIVEALSGSPLDLAPAFRAGFDRLDSYNIMMDLDGITRHGIIRMKYLIEEVSTELVDVGLVWTDLGQQGSEDTVQSIVYLGNGIVLAGTHGDAHILRSTDYGATWIEIFDGDTIGLTSIFTLAYLGNGVVVAGSNYTRILRSADYGLTWADLGFQYLDEGLESLSALASVGDGIALAGTHGAISGEGHILRSTDYGATWTDLGQPPANPYPVMGISIEGICPLGGGIVLAGVSNYGAVLRSTDYGATWVNLGQQASTNSIFEFADMGGGLIMAGTGITAKILRSVDYGLTWADLGANSPSVWMKSLAYLGDGVVVAGTSGDGRIFRSVDYGSTWADLGQQFSQAQISALESLGNGIALAGTALGGKILRSVGSNQ